MEGFMANNSGLVLIIYIVVFGAIMYFLMIRPQKNEQKRTRAMLESIAVGDYVLTTSGFYEIGRAHV